ncbi:MAG: FCD domain-containing protein [Anaerolineaceae bacterium]|nr:FCD domain-containing protein [Anaerolineaceae bacterium]
MRPVFKSKNEAVYDMLRQSIIEGEYEPGSRLVIDDLAESLGVSQIPIREALRQLEADGFITFEPYVGATLTEINANFIFEIFALLESLEVICSRAACRCMSEREMDNLAEIITNMDKNLENPEQWSQENKQLHLFVCECSKNVLTTKMTHKVLDHWDRLRLHYLKDVFGYRIGDAQREHKQILAAFRSRNPDTVEKAVREHNQNALQSYLQHLQSKGQILTSEDGCP